MRQVRARQRDIGPFQQMEGNQMPALRLGQAFQDAIRFRLLRGRQPAEREAVMQRRWVLRPRFLRWWRVLRRREAPALKVC